MHENTEFSLSREVDAIEIPSGRKLTLEKGTNGVITQTLGGSYTIATPYGLSRIAEKDLDALGLEKPKADAKEKATAKTNGAVSEDERSEEHTSELQSLRHLVCRLLLEKKKRKNYDNRRERNTRIDEYLKAQ